jgi:hypothetical protein
MHVRRTLSERHLEELYSGLPRFDALVEDLVANLATDRTRLARICEFARRLHQLDPARRR